MRRFLFAGVACAVQVATAAVTTFPVGPNPSASAPVAVAVDSLLNRAYVVQRELYVDVAVNVGIVPTNAVSVVDLATGNVVTTIPVGAGTNGLHQGIAADSTRQRVFVSNPDDNTVTIINTSTNTVVATTRVGEQPQGVAVDPETGLVYVACRGMNQAGTVAMLDATTGVSKGSVAVSGPAVHVAVDRSTHVAYVALDSAPWTVVAVDGARQTTLGRVELQLLFAASSIAVDPGSRVYVAFATSKAVAVIDSSAGPSALRESTRWLSVGLTPRAVAVDPATRSVYLTDSSTDQVLIWSSAGAQTKVLDVLHMPTGLCIDGNSSRAYVANTTSNSLSVINTSSQSLVGHILLATAPTGVAYDPTAQRIYATNFLTDTISVVNATTRAVVATWRPGTSPWAVAVDGSLQQLYSLNQGEGTLTALSTVDGRILKTINVGRPVQVVTVSPTSRRVFATAGENLTVLDGNTLNVLATVATGSRPVGIALDEAANRIYVANQQSGTISVLNATTYQIVSTWRPPLNNVWGLGIDPALRRLYVAIIKNTVADFGGIEVLNADTGDYVAQIATGAELVTVNSRTHTVYTTDIGGNAVNVIDGNANALAASVPVGVAPRDLTIDSASGFVYVANVGDGTVSIIDAVATATAPTISAQPQSQTVTSGATVTFGVTVAGTAPLSYQWRKDSVNLPGATSTTFSLTNVQTTHGGIYSVVVSNGAGSVTSNNATLIVNPAGSVMSPTISNQPLSQTATNGATVTFSVTVTGTAPLSYQWRKDGTNIAGATSSTLALSNVLTGSAGVYSAVISNPAGSVTSNAATLTISTTTVPGIVTHPQTQTVSLGGTVTLAFTSSGATPITYQWRKDGVNIPGANGSTFTLANVQVADSGSYTVVSANTFGSATSNPAIVSVATSAAPTISAPPQSQVVNTGGNVTLSVSAVSSSPVSYQWQKNGTNISGATSSTLALQNLQSTDAGSYTVVCTTVAGSVTSSAAILAVETNTSRITNLSIRSKAGTGAETLIVGFVVSGGNKSLLLRGVGPALRSYGVDGALGDPQIALYSGGTMLAANDDWNGAGNAAQVAATAAQLGAFPLSDGSYDAALLTAVNGGAYTTQTTGVGNTTGIALVELYDANATAASRLTNVSARTHVGSGEDILIAGFTLAGSGKKTILLRAIGPALTGYGVSGVLADPVLKLFRNGTSTAIANNDDWDGVAALREAFAQVGAFPLNSSSFDAALLVSLEPGSYTAHVSGYEGETGVALIELYEVN